MIFANIVLGKNVDIDPSSTFNNVKIGDGVKIAKMCSVFGSRNYPVLIGDGSYIGMMSVINGYESQLTIGRRVSIAPGANIMTDSGPNASPMLQSIYPIRRGPVTIGDDCWIGANTVIVPNVILGNCVVVGANSLVDSSWDSFSVIGGSPARLIRKFTGDEIRRLQELSAF